MPSPRGWRGVAAGSTPIRALGSEEFRTYFLGLLAATLAVAIARQQGARALERRALQDLDETPGRAG